MPPELAGPFLAFYSRLPDAPVDHYNLARSTAASHRLSTTIVECARDYAT